MEKNNLPSSGRIESPEPRRFVKTVGPIIQYSFNLPSNYCVLPLRALRLCELCAFARNKFPPPAALDFLVIELWCLSVLFRGPDMNWSDQTFIRYLSAVDDTLEAYYGVLSDQDDLKFIKQAHEDNVPPDTAALRLRAKGS
jgi:hypothetical protein